MYGRHNGTVSLANQIYADERLTLLDLIAACRDETGTPICVTKGGANA